MTKSTAVVERRWSGLEQVASDLYSIVRCLSGAIDLTAVHVRGDFLGHSQRVAYICSRLALRLGFRDPELRNLLLAALLHDCGVSTAPSRLSLLRSDLEATEPHCLDGADLVSRFAAISSLAPVIRSHHDHWAGGNPSGLSGREIPLNARIIHLADRIDIRFNRERFTLSQRWTIRGELQTHSGSMFDPELVDEFGGLAEEEAFWFELSLQQPGDVLSDPRWSLAVELDIQGLRQVAGLFGMVVDRKSKYTMNHSRGVAAVAALLASRLGYPTDVVSLVEVAGLLHDLGKLGVPDEILEKPGSLSSEEYDLMKRHAFDTYRILAGIPGFADIACWAAFHHERLDGKGYPFHKMGAELPVLSRVVAVADVFQALNEDRPYRPRLERQALLDILNRLVTGGALDGDIAGLVCRDYDLYATAAGG